MKKAGIYLAAQPIQCQSYKKKGKLYIELYFCKKKKMIKAEIILARYKQQNAAL